VFTEREEGREVRGVTTMSQNRPEFIAEDSLLSPLSYLLSLCQEY
jgi:hypothetical protein